MYDLRNISYFLDVEFYKSSMGLIMHQSRYASEILKRFKMEDCNVALTPAKPRLQLMKDSNEDDVDPIQYRRLIGSLRYLFHIRSDLEYKVGMMSRFIQKSKVSHLEATKRILRYLKGTQIMSFCFLQQMKERNANLWYTLTQVSVVMLRIEKSIVGYMFMLGSAPISWSSRKEPVAVMSSCEAEYIVASLCTCQATWMVNLIDEIARKNHGTLIMKIDNISNINLDKNPIARGRRKHIDMRFHYLKE
ncbi:secreted RxLR effector protein 161-like [Lathyrus oleraceus]|uniref:secreted RxLR effector protein 161-like n=1 Tax=Pisum sativum TaxID=3888 RepID=UPI0021D104F1|nr:secreted RxLR effector protein 161-like [Pisum sativum]